MMKEDLEEIRRVFREELAQIGFERPKSSIAPYTICENCHCTHMTHHPCPLCETPSQPFDDVLGGR